MIDVLYRGEQYIFLRAGSLIIRLNDSKNIKLEPHETFLRKDNESYYNCVESDYYEISQDLLKEICDASSIEIQISAKNTLVEIIDKEKKYVFPLFLKDNVGIRVYLYGKDLVSLQLYAKAM
ncbi:MAG: hypothetical protein IJ882_01485 [Paludibacteraceae bacterium]|nr:hypothetical protein [Paludibacteraceae bacterium]